MLSSAPPRPAPPGSPFTRFSALMQRVMTLFWLFVALLGILVAHQYWTLRQADRLTAQSQQVFDDILQVRARLQDLLEALYAFEQLQNPEILAPRVACGALCEHLPRLGRHVHDTPEMRELAQRAQVWDARLMSSLTLLVATARAEAPAGEVQELLLQARNVELPQLRRKIDEIAFAEVGLYGERQAAQAQAGRELLVALLLMTLAGIAAMRWLLRRAHRVAQDGLRTEEAVRALALQDELTGLPNRRLLAEFVPLLLGRARRHDQPVALMRLDLEGLAPIRARQGAPRGDLLLREAAECMRATLREGDLLVHLGGDGFVAVLLDGSASAYEVLRVGQRLVEALGRPLALPDDSAASLGISIGLACFPTDGQRLDALLSAADQALGNARRAGPNRLCRAGCEPVTHVLAAAAPHENSAAREPAAGPDACRPAPLRATA